MLRNLRIILNEMKNNKSKWRLSTNLIKENMWNDWDNFLFIWLKNVGDIYVSFIFLIICDKIFMIKQNFMQINKYF